jgi:paraquat-inducible protein B
MTNNSETADIVKLSNRSFSFAWVVPCIAVLIALGLFVQWQLAKGPLITIAFEDANGITPESLVMYRGTIVGRVESIQLSEDSTEVLVHARLQNHASSLAREGSAWWVVHPSVSLQGVQGLETIVGPRYIAVLPGSGEQTFTFNGSPHPTQTGGAPYVLIAGSADNLSIGSPIFYKGIEVGMIQSIMLAKNASTVRLGCYIQDLYTPLIRTNSVFWNVSGIRIDANLLGIDLQAGPITSWVKGGISFATPNDVGAIAPEGYAFTLEEDVDDDWLDWSPEINLPNVHDMDSN